MWTRTDGRNRRLWEPTASGIGRLMGASIEQNHDDKGIIWPITITPYQVIICPLYREGTIVAEKAEEIYRQLNEAGLEVLMDDREESPGVKFNDADLLGISPQNCHQPAFTG